MARIELATELAQDFDRELDHLKQYDVADANARIREIIDAISVLERNPYIGRPKGAGRRELVIGRSACGYIALYRYVVEVDTAFVLALRSQRAAGYSREE